MPATGMGDLMQASKRSPLLCDRGLRERRWMEAEAGSRSGKLQRVLQAKPSSFLGILHFT